MEPSLYSKKDGDQKYREGTGTPRRIWRSLRGPCMGDLGTMSVGKVLRWLLFLLSPWSFLVKYLRVALAESRGLSVAQHPGSNSLFSPVSCSETSQANSKSPSYRYVTSSTLGLCPSRAEPE